MSLPPIQAELWELYCASEKDRIRAVSTACLNRFLESLETLPMDAWREWAYDVCRRRVDCGDSFPVRMPLFEKALAPALLFGLQEKHPGCARWIAGLGMFLSHRPSIAKQLETYGRSGADFLELALQHDPSDLLAKRRLIYQLESYLEYALHELPSGVLGGNGGATPEECEEYLTDLSRLRGLLPLEGVNDNFSELIQQGEFHFRRYQDYLAQRDHFTDYPHYLASQQEKPGFKGPVP